MKDIIFTIAGSVLVVFVVLLTLAADEQRNNDYVQQGVNISWSNGSLAYTNGVPADANPEMYTPYRRAWLEGWTTAKLKHDKESKP
jgi:hypothetical protein